MSSDINYKVTSSYYLFLEAETPREHGINITFWSYKSGGKNFATKHLLFESTHNYNKCNQIEI
jgi:hypothetical protein